jgi:hypothetical protein
MSTETYTLRVTRVVNGWIVEPVVSHHSRAPTQDIMIVPDGEDLGAYINAQITSQKLMTDEKRESLLINPFATSTTTAGLQNAAHNLYITDEKVYVTSAATQQEAERALKQQGVFGATFRNLLKP